MDQSADRPASRKGALMTQYLAAFAVNVLSLAYGTALGWNSPALPYLQSQPGSPVTVEHASWIASINCLSALFSTPLWGLLASKVGRRTLCLLVAPPLMVNWTLVLVAELNLAALYIARILVGFVAAGMIVAVPLFVAEIVEDRVRGELGALMILEMSVGILMAYVLGAVASYHVLCASCLVISLVFVPLFAWMPDSPWYLANSGRPDAARRSLLFYRGSRFDIEGELEKLTSGTNEETLHLQNRAGGPPVARATLRSRGTVRGMVLCSVLLANQQLSGVFVVLFYAQRLMKDAGSSLDPAASAAVVGALLLAGNVAASLLADRAGRRPLLLTSDVGMAVSLAATAVYTNCRDASLHPPGWVPIVSLSLFIVFYAIGFCSIPFVVQVEVFSPEFRARASAVCTSLMWLLAFLTVKLYPNMEGVLGEAGCYWLFSSVCFAGTVFTAIYLPETKGRSVESILKEMER